MNSGGPLAKVIGDLCNCLKHRWTKIGGTCDHCEILFLEFLKIFEMGNRDNIRCS
jgi:hypothetical protein